MVPSASHWRDPEQRAFYLEGLRLAVGETDVSQTRRLAAILAADVAGYSRLMGADEEGTLERLKALRRELLDPKIAEHHGRIVKTTGDGLLVEFASVVDAVRWQSRHSKQSLMLLLADLLERVIERTASSQCIALPPVALSSDDEPCNISAIRLLSSATLNGFARRGIAEIPPVRRASAYPVISNVLSSG